MWFSKYNSLRLFSLSLLLLGYQTYINAQSSKAYQKIGIDFIKPSEKSINTVVFIKVLSQTQNVGFDPFWGMFGNVGPSTSTGSGVIISDDGYIVTNYHVIQNPQKIEVILNNNKRSYTATIIGVDPSTDLALLKISANNLQYASFGNSDNLRIGEWVIAVGNPFNLTSSVTAGIVSAKGRNINVVQNQFPIESFIQTDAAINPGNSGGALINLDGDLVGINTAILSKTGSYSGYGFAIPSNIVKKITSDLKDFGYIQRAFVEADIADIDSRLAEKIEDESINGVYIRSVYNNGNAFNAGLIKGDIITKVNDKIINNRAEFDEQIAYSRPGDKISIQYKRGKELLNTAIVLSNDKGTTTLDKSKIFSSELLGASFEEISKIEKEKYKISTGFRVSQIKYGGIISRMNLPNGFIIHRYNFQIFNSEKDLIKAIETTNGKITIEGFYPNGHKASLQFYLN